MTGNIKRGICAKRVLAVAIAALLAMCSLDLATAGQAIAQVQGAESAAHQSWGDANSWRYCDGERIDEADSEGEGTGQPAGLEEWKEFGGYTLATEFDRFQAGYYTGTDAYKGVDISEHNGYVDWAQMKAAGVDYAIIRLGYGDDWYSQDDACFAWNYQQAKANGIKVGVYLYSYALRVSGDESAESEAAHTLRLLQDNGISPDDLDFPVYYDMEDSSTIGCDLSGIADKYLSTIKAAGYRVGVYASLYWWNTYLTSSVFDQVDSRWCAQWNGPDYGLTYGALSDFRNSDGMWQFTDRGDADIYGVSNSYVDLNYSYYEKYHVDPYELRIDTSGLNVGSTIYVDGKAYELDESGCTTLPDFNAKTVTAYEYAQGDSDAAGAYPVRMYAWTLSHDGHAYTATRMGCFDDLLGYAGCSIRVSGVQGMRMATLMPSATRFSLVNGAVSGYTLEEYGTVVAYKDVLGDADLVLGASGSASAYAYKRDVADAVFDVSVEGTKYTNVLTGIAPNDYDRDVAMRAYAVIRAPSGDEITLYGGTVYRSVRYVAQQNAGEYAPGSAAYEYIQGIISAG